MKYISTIIQTTLQISIFLILPFVLFTFITSKTPLIYGLQSFVVLTGSMSPTIPVGSVIYTQKESEYSSSQVISYERDSNTVVTHRIIQVIKQEGKTYYRTLGDANDAVDSYLVPSEKVIGKVFISVPYVGYISNFLKTPLGFSALIIFPTVVFIIFELWNIKKEIEKEAEKRVMKRLTLNSTETPETVW